MRTKTLWADLWQDGARYQDNVGDVWRGILAPVDALSVKGTGKPSPALVLEWLEEAGDAAPVAFWSVATRAALGPLRPVAGEYPRFYRLPVGSAREAREMNDKITRDDGALPPAVD